ncbi:MAG: cytochrome d ubiquinol oxidase subunit II [Pseudolabrys sp.]|nr:cytochrome d ubiquinol oxidase subunit II [Pseudolabrys sp.]
MSFDLAFLLPLAWAAIIGLAVAMYVLMDGYDLGIGLLFPLARGESERDTMMASIKPYWDGNETWLILGGGGLLVAFPRAYSIIMPALYLPVIAMLLGLIFRGVAIEFRGLAKDKRGWNWGFTLGSGVAGFAQGVILGGLIQGIKTDGTHYTGGTFDWLTPFALACGVGTLIGYALLGATWVVMKTSGHTAKDARRHAAYALIGVIVFMAIVSLWTPLAFPRIAERWFSLPNFFYFSPVPVLTAAAALACLWGLIREKEILPFAMAMALFMLGYLGLVISVFPHLVPPTLTIWDAAASTSSQTFMLVGTAILLPIILAYTAFVYWLFRGKVREGESYH